MRLLNLREVQLSQLEILKEIANVCENEKLKYSLMYGTLLGAIRHNGFIPWDDDIDICMPRPDYEKLLTCLIKNPIKNLKIYNKKTCVDYPYIITRIGDTRYELEVENEKKYGIGTFIDIYILDGLGNDVDEAKKFLFKMKPQASFIFLATRLRFTMGLTKGLLRKALKYPSYIYAKIMGPSFFVKKLEKAACKYSYEDSLYVGCVIWAVNGAREVFKKDLIENTILMDFEGCKFRVPEDYDNILKQIYGNYIKMPPEADRIPHHTYDAYLKD